MAVLAEKKLQQKKKSYLFISDKIHFLNDNYSGFLPKSWHSGNFSSRKLDPPCSILQTSSLDFYLLIKSSARI